MSMPFYVPPEQMMKDRADFARKGISRGRALAALQFADGIVLVAENPSTSLRKISEIYDRIAFAGVGKFNEFDQLRVAGVRFADLKGYQFSRADVDARGLANQYAQVISQAFTHDVKPLEVEILVAELGWTAAGDQLFRIMYDGTVIDERRFSAIGGDVEAIRTRLADRYRPGAAFDEAVKAAVQSLEIGDRRISHDELEVAVLQRDGERRCFRRIGIGSIGQILS